MHNTIRLFVQTSVDAVDVVLADPEGQYNPEYYDRYETFESARDAALTSVEVMLDEQDYDDESHREELERMRAMLEAAETYGDLAGLHEYQSFLTRLHPTVHAA